MSDIDSEITGELVALLQIRTQGGRDRSAATQAIKELRARESANSDLSPAVSLRLRAAELEVVERTIDYGEARRLWDDLLNESEGALVLHHPVASTIRAGLARMARFDGDLAEAERLARQEISIRTKAYGASALRTSIARLNLAAVLNETGPGTNRRRALQIAEEEVALRRKTWGEQHSFTDTARFLAARITVTEAEEQPGALSTPDLVQHLQICEALTARRLARTGAASASTLRAERLKARVLILLGEHERAEWVLQRVSAAEQVGGVIDPSITERHLARARAGASESE